MDRPTDLTGRSPGEQPDDGSDDVARAFRAALDGTGSSSSSSGSGTTTASDASQRQRPERPSVLLSLVERRAARMQRRRQAAALGGAAAAAAVAVFVSGLVLPGFDLSLGGASPSSAGGSAESRSDSDDSGASGGAAAPDAGASAPSGTALDGSTSSSEGLQSSAAAAAPTLSEASMLTAADLTGAFSVPVRESAPAPESTPSLTLGACVDGDAGSVEAQQLWRVDLTAAPSASAAEPPGVVERVAVVAGPAAAVSALDEVREALPGCTGDRLEGTGPVTVLDATTVTPEGGQALVLASTSSQGSPTLQVLVASGSELVQLEVVSDAASAEQALERLATVVRTAVDRATGGGATWLTPLPSAGAP